MAKVVIDANIIVSAAFGGKPLEAMVRATISHEVYVSSKIERELREVFLKLSRKLTEAQLAFIGSKIDELMGMATLVAVSKAVALSRDAKDDHYLSLCREVRADFLITGDKDLLDIPEGKLKKANIRTRVVNPREFLEEASKTI